MAVKHRIVGLIVIIALAMIIIPILLNHSQLETNNLQLSSKVPKAPPKPSMTIAIPPQAQTMPQALPLQRAPEKEITPEPPVSMPAAPIPSLTNGSLQTGSQAAQQSITTTQVLPAAPNVAPEKLASQPKKQVIVKKITPPPAQAWVIQLGSFSSKANADNLVKKLKTNGYKAYMHESTTNQGKMYTVFVGPNIQHNMTEQTAQQLEKTFNLKGMVVKYTI